MTQAAWRLRLASTGEEVLIETDAMERGVARVTRGVGGADESAAPQRLAPWSTLRLDDGAVKVATAMLTVSVETARWQVNVTSKPVYGLIPDVMHDFTRWQHNQRRLDVSIHGAFPQPDAHGVLGQAYQDETVRNGALDEYDIEYHAERADSDGRLKPIVTKAQAQGAIEGLFVDYRVTGPSDTAFRYSRYDAEPHAPTAADAHKLRRVASSANDWDGAPGSLSSGRARPPKAGTEQASLKHEGKGKDEV